MGTGNPLSPSSYQTAHEKTKHPGIHHPQQLGRLYQDNQRPRSRRCPAQSEVCRHLIGSSAPRLTRAPAGVLIECDPSIKSIIVNIDSVNHDYIIEDLDEERVVVKETMVAALKLKLEDVRNSLLSTHSAFAISQNY